MLDKNKRIDTPLPDGGLHITWENSPSSATISLSSIIKFHKSEVKNSKGTLKRYPLKILIELMMLNMIHKHCDVDLSTFDIHPTGM